MAKHCCVEPLKSPSQDCIPPTLDSFLPLRGLAVVSGLLTGQLKPDIRKLAKHCCCCVGEPLKPPSQDCIPPTLDSFLPLRGPAVVSGLLTGRLKPDIRKLAKHCCCCAGERLKPPSQDSMYCTTCRCCKAAKSELCR